ncbi:HdeD family acid-resistance protein [Thiohalocapsa marina]|uniref:HdeD family acid-resistance protein n=1 Tax=Thiohalocapsa marina TaxID=424902 RepID=UPI0036DE98D1
MPNSINLTSVPITVFGELEKNWGWLLAFGLASVALGTLGLGMTFMFTEATAVFIGALLIVGGVLQLLEGMKCRGWKSIAWHVLIALLYVGAGLVTVLHPQLAALSLTLMLAWILVGIGIVRSVIAFQMRPARGWYWPLLSGLVSLVLGGMILYEWPESGLWFIGLYVAIELIFNGWSYLFIAQAARAAGKRRKQADA